MASSWHDPQSGPWSTLAGGTNAHCNICRWEGAAFDGPAHCEGARCPQCGSIARDRFLFWALRVAVAQPAAGTAPLRVLETSPRLDGRYRRAMGDWFDYLCSDFDERAHAGTVQLDLQDIALPSESFDVVLSAHVLEHVPDTDAALRELYRILAPGGTLLLQVPVLQERTAVPARPEFHGDNTPVAWRFGPDLSDRLAAAGFEVHLLATDELLACAVAAPDAAARPWGPAVSPEFDVEALLRGLRRDTGGTGGTGPISAELRAELQGVADAAAAARHGFQPAYMFLTWACVKPGEQRSATG
ncbi:MAG: class I SAM-dependent methyltransferase [Acidimicrobiales bacterium]